MLTIKDIDNANERIKAVVKKTPLERSKRLSDLYNAEVYLKREDLQIVRSFKLRGAYNAIAKLPTEKTKKGIVCASAGNHAQGVAYACYALKIKGYIYMPTVTPNQKIQKVRDFGKEYVEVVLIGDTFDEAFQASVEFCDKNNLEYIHPFNNSDVIAGQGTVGLEIVDEIGTDIDYAFICVGGGGLASGISTYLKSKIPSITTIGVEPTGAASMKKALEKGDVITLDTIDTFVDGAAVKRVGDITFKIFEENIDEVVDVPEGLVCKTMIELYQNDGIIAEPAGALSVAALQKFKDKIVGKKVVCIISGGNNDLLRYPEILERSLVYEGLKHYFIINFKQKPGELKRFLKDALGPTDDIVRFEYVKKTNAERGPAFVGIQIEQKDDYEKLLERMKLHGIDFRIISDEEMIYKYLV